MAAASREVIVETEEGVRLLGYHARVNPGTPRGLVCLLHGWEGSSDSTYIRHTGRYLFERGYDIFRLNLRDHGNSHGLNEGLFHSALIEETFSAVGSVAKLAGGRPFHLIGFSLGGNFALRIALRHGEVPVSNLRRVFAVSPVLDPLRATRAIDGGLFVYRRYFVRKWLRSLMKKQALFPGRYDFGDILRFRTCMDITDAVIPRYSPFPDSETYFKTYTLTGDAFSGLTLPVVVIAAEDDPVIPVDDFFALRGGRHLAISIQRRGGHCGFLDPFPFGCWYERYIHARLESPGDS